MFKGNIKVLGGPHVSRGPDFPTLLYDDAQIRDLVKHIIDFFGSHLFKYVR
jgi:hypothetical protein